MNRLTCFFTISVATGAAITLVLENSKYIISHESGSNEVPNMQAGVREIIANHPGAACYDANGKKLSKKAIREIVG